MSKKIILLWMIVLGAINASAKLFTLTSPDGDIVVNVDVSTRIGYNVRYKNQEIIEKSFLALNLTDGKNWGVNPKLQKADIKHVDNKIEAPIYKRKIVPDIYNELVLKFKGNYQVVFRAYDDGIAYRFVSTSRAPFNVQNEEAVFNFPQHSEAYVAYVRENGYHPDNMTNNGTFEEQFFKSFVNTYTRIPLRDWSAKRLAFMPLLVEVKNGVKICLTEADLINYPGMYLNGSGDSNSLKGVFAPYPQTVKQGGSGMLQEVVLTREDYIAKCGQGLNEFPWRTCIIAENDFELLDSDMVYRLSTPNQIDDISWIKPGKSAWEWWNDFNVSGVDFEAGVNNATYKYYIDFAHENGLEYMVIDEGWYENGKIMEPVEALDLAELVEYGKERNVGLILWTGCYPFKQRMEEVCKHYSEIGIKGFKIDFIDRDDQSMVNFHYEASKMAAKYKLVLDFHGTYKPTGLQRTYPNALTFEAVQGLEHMKWASPAVDQITYDVTMPYIRMVAGPLDYTQGAMRNANEKNYKPIYSDPMSQGTRVRQMAEYIVFESPLSMLCDSPDNYRKEKECTDFIAEIPTVWDESKALNGEITKYITIARKKDNEWYVGSINNRTPRELELDLSFLGDGVFRAEVFKDGINAGRVAQDYKREIVDIPTSRKLSFYMESGGGFVMKITQLK